MITPKDCLPRQLPLKKAFTSIFRRHRQQHLHWVLFDTQQGEWISTLAPHLRDNAREDNNYKYPLRTLTQESMKL